VIISQRGKPGRQNLSQRTMYMIWRHFQNNISVQKESSIRNTITECATRGTEWLGYGPQTTEGARILFFATASIQDLGPTQSPIQRAPGVRRPKCEADHSPPSSNEVKNAWSYASTPPYVFMAWYVMK